MSYPRIRWAALFPGLAAGLLLFACSRSEGPPSDPAEDGSEERAVVRIPADAYAENGIEIATAEPATIRAFVDLPGEIRANRDRLAELHPRFPGIVKEVRKRVGESVRAGETLARIESSETLAPYSVEAVMDGTVLERNIALGEAVSTETTAFVVGDLATVWVDLSVFQRDLDAVRTGQEVTVHAPSGTTTRGVIGYVSSIVDEKTRTGLARVVLPNPEGRWRPGTFVTVRVAIGETHAPVALRPSALQSVGGEAVVFVPDGNGLRAQPVRTGRSDDEHVEVLDGLEPGERYVAKGAYQLASELEKETFAEDDD